MLSAVETPEQGAAGARCSLAPGSASSSLWAQAVEYEAAMARNLARFQSGEIARSQFSRELERLIEANDSPEIRQIVKELRK